MSLREEEDTPGTHVHRGQTCEDTARRSRLQAKERGLQRSRTPGHLDPGPAASTTVRKSVLLSELPVRGSSGPGSSQSHAQGNLFVPSGKLRALSRNTGATVSSVKVPGLKALRLKTRYPNARPGQLEVTRQTRDSNGTLLSSLKNVKRTFQSVQSLRDLQDSNQRSSVQVKRERSSREILEEIMTNISPKFGKRYEFKN